MPNCVPNHPCDCLGSPHAREIERCAPARPNTVLRCDQRASVSRRWAIRNQSRSFSSILPLRHRAVRSAKSRRFSCDGIGTQCEVDEARPSDSGRFTKTPTSSWVRIFPARVFGFSLRSFRGPERHWSDNRRNADRLPASARQHSEGPSLRAHRPVSLPE